MKNFLKAIPCLAVFALLFTIESCKPTCDIGYEGNHCTTPVRNKFLGVLFGSQNCGGVNDTCTVTISEISGDVTKIRIRNLGQSSMNTTGTVMDDGTIIIPNQNFAGGIISGTATAGDKIKIEFVVTGGSIADSSCTWTQN